MIHKKPYVEKVEIHDLHPTSDQIHQLSRTCWIGFLKRNYSKIVKLFFGQYKSTVRCPECNKISTTFDPFQVISLPIPSISVESFHSYFITPNYNAGADKFEVEIRYEKKGTTKIPTIQDCLNGFAEFKGIDARLLKLYTLGFSGYGDIISGEMLASDFNTMINKNSYSPRPFILQLTEEEYVKMENPDSFTVMGLVVKGFEKPAFNKVVYMRPADSAMILYYEVFKKFAHFYKCEYEDQIFTTVKSTVDYIQSFKDNYTEKTKIERAFTLKYREEEIPMSTTTKLSDIFSAEEMISAERLVKIEICLSDYVTDKIFLANMKSCNISDSVVKVGSDTNQPSKLDIKYLIKKLSEPEQVDEDNMFFCSKCDKHVRIEKTFEIYTVPSHLMIQMKKLKLGYQRKERPVLDISFELDGMDLTDFVVSKTTIDAHNLKKTEFATPENSKFDSIVDPTPESIQNSSPQRLIYDLYGVINHSGSNWGGHYTAYAKSDGSWHYYDDERVTAVQNLEDIVSERAYVLFYKLRK